MTDTTKSVVLDRELEEEKNQDSSGSCIRYPLCGWSPRKEDKWFCTCGHEWNSFDTGRVCPACLHEWVLPVQSGRVIRTGTLVDLIMNAPNLIVLLLTIVLMQASAIGQSIPKPGIKEVQVPYSSLKVPMTLKIGGTADWVLVTSDAVWVASAKPYDIVRIDPATNKIVARVRISDEACSGLAFGFNSVWVPICGSKPALVRIDAVKNTISAVLPIAPAGEEGGIAASDDSVWMVTDKNGTLVRVDPNTNSVRDRIHIPPGSFNPVFDGGIVWITGVESNVLTAVDATSGTVLESMRVGSKPRFLTAGAGSVWTLNQGDGTISRVDEKGRQVATIQVGIPGTGGDISFGADSIWSSVFEVPLTRIDAKTNRVVKQWMGEGGDSLRIGFGSVWITDYKKGLLSRIPMEEVQ